MSLRTLTNSQDVALKHSQDVFAHFLLILRKVWILFSAIFSEKADNRIPHNGQQHLDPVIILVTVRVMTKPWSNV